MLDGSAFAGIGSVLSTAKDLLGFIDEVQKFAGSRVISAYFKWDGTRLDGDEEIVAERHDGTGPAQWWFSIKDIADYVFVRFPVVGSCAHELVGTEKGTANPDSRYWRWIEPMPPGAIVGGERPNLKVNFVVIGYKPKALIKHFSSSP